MTSGAVSGPSVTREVRGFSIITSPACGRAVNVSCGGRSGAGHQPRMIDGGATGLRAISTCSIAPTRAPVGSRSPQASTLQIPGRRATRSRHTAAGRRPPGAFLRDEYSIAAAPARMKADEQPLLDHRVHDLRRAGKQRHRVVGGARRVHCRDVLGVAILAAPHEHRRRALASRDGDVDSLHRDSREPELLVEGGADLREEQRRLDAVGARGVLHRVDDGGRVPAAAQLPRREHRADAERARRAAVHGHRQVIPLRRRDDGVAVDEREAREVALAPEGLLLRAGSTARSRAG